MQHSKTPKTLVILAGGMASRYGGKKQIEPVGPNHECLLEYALYDAIHFGFSKFVFVINSYFDETIQSYFSDILKAKHVAVHFVYQNLSSCLPDAFHALLQTRVKPWGTAHAVLVTKEIIQEPFVVMNADDYYGPMVFQKMANAIQENNVSAKEMLAIAFPIAATLSHNGSVSRGVCEVDKNGFLLSIIERTQILQTEHGIAYLNGETFFPILTSAVVSMNSWAFDSSIYQYLEKLFIAFLKLNDKNLLAEFYLPAVINELVSNGQIRVRIDTTSDEWFGITYAEDKQLVIDKIKEKISLGKYPAALWK
jgi:NDP-sugar pyrophosphorylase family protein